MGVGGRSMLSIESAITGSCQIKTRPILASLPAEQMRDHDQLPAEL